MFVICLIFAIIVNIVYNISDFYSSVYIHALYIFKKMKATKLEAFAFFTGLI